MSWKTIPVKFDSFFDWKRSTKKHGDFEVEVDVNGFDDREIEVKVFGREVSVRCLHEDQNNRRELNRSYRLPDDVDVNSVESKLSNRGILTIRAAKREPIHHESTFPQSTGFTNFPSLKKSDFEVELDVHEFKPEEVEVKRYLFYHSNLDSSQTVKNEISRSYVLPTDIDPDSVKSKLSDRGILTVVAYKKA
uniref:SHSP domain-containing protein n=1 Tax=Meloidogyne javanica TaxID=6303 RepID=A0A915MEL6_MELJA